MVQWEKLWSMFTANNSASRSAWPLPVIWSEALPPSALHQPCFPHKDIVRIHWESGYESDRSGLILIVVLLLCFCYSLNWTANCMLSSRILKHTTQWSKPWSPTMKQYEAALHQALLPDSFRSTTFWTMWHYDGCHCDSWSAQKAWNVTFLNRLRHEKREENTFVNRQSGAHFLVLVLKACGSTAIHPSLDLTSLGKHALPHVCGLRHPGPHTLGLLILRGLGGGSTF